MRKIVAIEVYTEEPSHIGILRFTERIENPKDNPILSTDLIGWLKYGLSDFSKKNSKPTDKKE